MRLQETLNSILDLAQLEGGSLELEIQHLDIAREVLVVADKYENAARRKGLKFGVQVPAESVESALDSASLQRVVKSLIDNAVKFTEQGSVLVEVAAEKGHAIIRVRDTGIGISESFLSHLFSEFQQESMGHARSYEGTGLGLAITKRLVELMGGRIEVESRRGEGSTFSVAFPTSSPGSLYVEARDLEQPAAAGEHAASRILIVDDNTDTLALTRHQLCETYEIVTASDVESAMQSARSGQFDALLLDINLGDGHDGVDVMRALRQMDSYREVPIVALTAYAMPGDRERFLDAGFDGYLSKPFTKKEITETIRGALSLQRAA
jgi:CheY-like chemotaxis protein/anti-sigma regulatory factor (Ser/Thr protein kinase)